MAKTIAVTGANSGAGKAVAEQLARSGERALLICRDRQRGETCDVAAQERLRAISEKLIGA